MVLHGCLVVVFVFLHSSIPVIVISFLEIAQEKERKSTNINCNDGYYNNNCTNNEASNSACNNANNNTNNKSEQNDNELILNE